jgi:predicted dehydrogenase
MAGARFRYIADLIQARGLIQSGILGKILVFEIDFRNFGDTDNYTGFWPDREMQGVIMDRGNHAIDIARYFFGPIMRIRAEEAVKYKLSGLEDTVRLDRRSVSGVIGTAQLSRTLKNPREDYIRIYGTRGTLCIGWKASAYRLNGFADWTKFGEGFSKLRAVRRQIENLLHAIKDEATPETTSEDGYELVRALEAAYRSLSTKEWIELSTDPVARIERKFRVLRPA